MILIRHGNKRAIAHLIIPHFPKHDTYIEPFFGAGGMFFSKPKAKYNIINDIDDDVFNLFQVLKTNPKELKKQYENTPISQSIFLHYKTHQETDPILKAVRFIILSNFGLYGSDNTFRIGNKSVKANNINQIDTVNQFISTNTDITNLDYKILLTDIPIRRQTEQNKMFIYADPPYHDTKATYNGFSKQDTEELIDTLQQTNIKFALSSYRTPFILHQALDRGLNINHIRKVKAIKGWREEVLITNYDTNVQIQQELFSL